MVHGTDKSERRSDARGGDDQFQIEVDRVNPKRGMATRKEEQSNGAPMSAATSSPIEHLAPHEGAAPETVRSDAAVAQSPDENALAVVLNPWRPIVSRTETRQVLGVNLLVGLLLTMAINGLGGSQPDQYTQTLFGIACAACVTNLLAIVWPLLGYATSLLGATTGVLLFMRFAKNYDSQNVPADVLIVGIFMLAMILLANLAAFRAASAWRSA